MAPQGRGGGPDPDRPSHRGAKIPQDGSGRAFCALQSSTPPEVEKRCVGSSYEEASDAPDPTQAACPAKAGPWPYTAARGGLQHQSGLGGGPATGKLPCVQQRGMHRDARLRGSQAMIGTAAIEADVEAWL